MKKFKRIFAIILSLVTVLSLLSFASMAEEEPKTAPAGELSLCVSAADVKPGDDPVIEIVLEKNTGFAVMVLALQLPEGMTVKSVENLVPDLNCTYAKSIVLDGTTNYTGTGALLKITCDIPADKRVNTADVKAAIIDACASDYSTPNFPAKASVVTVRFLEEKKVLPGDVNGNGSVDLMDLVRLQRYIAGSVTEINAENADVNGSGAVDIFDLIRLKKMIAGLA